MKNRIRIISISALFLIMISLAMIGITYGWFAHGIVFTTNHINVGDLRYALSGGDFIEDDTIIVPGDNLVDEAFVINNLSPITSQLRVKITYTRVTVIGEVITPEPDYAFKNDADDHLVVTFTSTFIFRDGEDTPENEYDDNCWYYNFESNEIIAAASGNINLFSEIYYDGNKASIEYNGQSLTVTISVEVKQADNVAWSVLTSFDFSTG